MLIQAMRIVTFQPSRAPRTGCYGTWGSFPSISYRISGPNMPYVVSHGIPSGECRSVSLSWDPPFTVSVGQNAQTGAIDGNVSSADAIVTYGYFGGQQPQMGSFIIVRVPPVP